MTSLSMEPARGVPSGLWLLPGLVDMHVHLRVPGGEESETLETGLRAAVAGGVTHIGMMPNTLRLASTWGQSAHRPSLWLTGRYWPTATCAPARTVRTVPAMP